MSPASRTSAHVPHPAITINTLLSMVNDCMERAGGCLDPLTYGPLDAAYVDQQLARAITYLAKARVVAINTHGVPGLTEMTICGAWHPDDVIELAPVSAGTVGKGGAK